ncbi:MAG: 1-deoxy-D-xylulose-5-phosphate synthase [Treponema sp.]|nr:1-deoxy-D-xylulose-5-phosphate synthase [Treponema sp.]
MSNVASLLSRITGPADLRRFRFRELERLADEIREAIVSRVARNGGHLASNLGVVELSIAMHRVFASPEDKIVWDVGHQCYAHKLLTGRYASFRGLRRAGGLAGFPKREESPHDAFNTGHASTSVSAALGLLAGQRLRGGRGRALAVIGDGALTGGLAYEALSHAGHLKLPLIVILNDNNMSISPNVGGISKYLSRLSMKAKYQSFRRSFDAMAQRIPFIGDVFFDYVVRLKRAVKAVFYIDNFFVDLGFEYVGPIDGHDIRLLMKVLEDVRRLDRPVVVHVITRKGKGYGFAEDDPGNYHGVGAFSVADGIEDAGIPRGSLPGSLASPVRPSFTDAFASAMLSAAGRDRRVVALTAAMEKGTGLSLVRNAYPGRFFDVGIAESHAVTFAAGLAAQGQRPVVAIYSTFIQRSVDQVIHDVALQNLPVVFALDRCGFVDGDGETHQGLFDIALFRPVPNMTILAPAGENELRMMLDYALCLDGPVMFRYPKALCPPDHPSMSFPLEHGRGAWLQREPGSRVCLAFTGSLYPQALEARSLLYERGLEADLYNLRFLKPVDEDYLEQILNSYDTVVFVEEGIRAGGFGEYATALARTRGCRAQTLVLAAAENFAAGGKALGTRAELLGNTGLDGAGIADRVREAVFPYESLGSLASREIRT